MPVLIGSYVTRLLPWLVGGLLLVGGWLFVRHLQNELLVARQDAKAAQTTIAQLTATNQEDLATLKRLQAESAIWQGTLSKTLASDADLTRFTDGLLASVAASPSASDASVAPVLQNTLSSIRKEQGAPK